MGIHAFRVGPDSAPVKIFAETADPWKLFQKSALAI
jgi:hypothetical protein